MEKEDIVETLIKQGEGFFINGDLALAERCFTKALEINPDSVDANNNLGVIYWQKSNGGENINIAKSVEYFKKALLIDPLNADANNNLRQISELLESNNSALINTNQPEKTDTTIQYPKKKLKPFHDLLKEANECYNSGDFSNARRLYKEVLEQKPNHADSLNMLGCIGFMDREYKESAEFIKQAIKINPKSAFYHNTLGNILFAQAKSIPDLNRAALDSFKKAIQLKSDYAEAHYNLALVCMEIGDNHTAMRAFKKAIQIKPDFFSAHTNMGSLLMKLGRLDEAINCFRNGLKAKPGDMALSVNLCLALQNRGENEEAIDVLKTALLYSPNNPEILFNLGNIYQRESKHGNDRIEEAIRCFKKALELAPNDSRIIYNLGTTLMESGNKKDALPFLEKVVEQSPNDSKALNNIGLINYFLGNYDKALEFYEKAVENGADVFKAYNNIGLVYKYLGQWDKAVIYFKKAIEITPDFAEVLHNLGEIQRELGQFEAAVKNCRKAIELQPDLTQANTHYSYLLKWLCEWEEFDRITAHVDPLIKKELENGEQVGETPFMNIIRVDDPEYNRRIADSFAKKTEINVRNLNINFDFQDRLSKWKVGQKENKKITVGYISANFRYHPMAHLLANLFKNHEREEFIINCYSLGPDDSSIYRRRFVEDSDLFRDIRGLSHVDAATQIYNDNVDILVDLMGWTQGNRLEIHALRPAPLQVRYMGLAGTTGGNIFDYIITDEIVTPKEQEQNYSEKFIWMPHTYQINDQSKIISDRAVTRAMYKLPEDSFVFCSFNQSYKIDPIIFSTWMSILRRVENSVLWLMPGNDTAGNNLMDAARKEGIDERRLIFATNLPLEEHLARLRLADLALDTRIIGGAATTSDALWAGLPVITLLGNRFASRMSASILNAIGLSELVAHTLQDYENLALNLALNKSILNQVRLKLKVSIDTMPLFNTAIFTKNLERGYKRIWQLYLSNEPPQLIDLKR